MQNSTPQSRLHAIEGNMTTHQRSIVSQLSSAQALKVSAADLLQLGTTLNVPGEAVKAFGEANRSTDEERIRSLWMLRNAIPRS